MSDLYTGYEELLGNPHELCQWAKDDIEKCYQDSCKQAVKDIIEKNKKRIDLVNEANRLLDKLLTDYDGGDRECVADVLELVRRNLGR